MSEVKIYLSAVRANTGLNQNQWAEKLGVSPTTVKNWELGNSKPDMNQLRTMSDLSGIPMEFIFAKESINNGM